MRALGKAAAAAGFLREAEENRPGDSGRVVGRPFVLLLRAAVTERFLCEEAEEASAVDRSRCEAAAAAAPGAAEAAAEAVVP